MFDIGFSEIFVVAVIALLVLGPERLPKAARFAGLWVRRARAQWYSVKSEFERELADEELKRSLRDARDDLHEAGRQLNEGGAALRREVETMDPDRAAAAVGVDDQPSGNTPSESEPSERAPSADAPSGNRISDGTPAKDVPADSAPADDHASRD